MTLAHAGMESMTSPSWSLRAWISRNDVRHRETRRVTTKAVVQKATRAVRLSGSTSAAGRPAGERKPARQRNALSETAAAAAKLPVSETNTTAIRYNRADRKLNRAEIAVRTARPMMASPKGPAVGQNRGAGLGCVTGTVSSAGGASRPARARYPRSVVTQGGGRLPLPWSGTVHDQGFGIQGQYFAIAPASTRRSMPVIISAPSEA